MAALLLLCGCAHSKPTILFRGEHPLESNPRHVLGSAHAHAFERGMQRPSDGSTNISVILLEDLLHKAEMIEQITHPLPELAPSPPK